MTDIIIAVAVVAGIGAVCAVMLVLAARFFSVKEDETYVAVRELLPGANCGACGYAGCDGYAKALAEDKDNVKTNLCIPGGDGVSRQISNLLGVEFADVIEQVAVVHCRGDCAHTTKKMEYEGISTCRAAKTLYGGHGSCSYGCIGFGDCVAVCPQNAIHIMDGIAHIEASVCVGCGLCAHACPSGLITLMGDEERALVTCNNTEKGAVTKSKCDIGCIGCKKCEKTCEKGAVKVVDNLARIDYDICDGCGACASACPVGCIVIADFRGIHKSGK